MNAAARPFFSGLLMKQPRGNSNVAFEEPPCTPAPDVGGWGAWRDHNSAWAKAIEKVRRLAAAAAEPDFDPPTPVASRRAVDALKSLEQYQAPPPTRVTADGLGGISIEWDIARGMRRISVDEEGEVVGLVLRNHTVMSQHKLLVPHER